MFLGGSCSARLWIARESLLFFRRHRSPPCRPRPINVDFVGFPLHHAEATNLHVFSPDESIGMLRALQQHTRGGSSRGKGASRHPLLFLSGYIEGDEFFSECHNEKRQHIKIARVPVTCCLLDTYLGELGWLSAACHSGAFPVAQHTQEGAIPSST